jgi:hypothetical protein
MGLALVLVRSLLLLLGVASSDIEDSCTIDTISVDELTIDLLKGFITAARPLMIRGGLRHAGWRNFTMEDFLEDFGELDATLGKQDRFAYAWWPPVRVTGNKITVVSFVDAMLEEGLHRSGNAHRQTLQIIFNTETRGGDDFWTPEPFSELCTDRLYEPPQLNIGVNGTGAPPHNHRQIWNGLLRGRKQWFLLGRSVQGLDPEGVHNSTGQMTVRDWLDSSGGVTELVRKGHNTCVQEAGDVLYVPHAEQHATLNLAAECVAVAQAFCHKVDFNRNGDMCGEQHGTAAGKEGAIAKSEEEEDGEEDDDEETLPDFYQQMLAYKLPGVQVSIVQAADDPPFFVQ